MNKLEQKLHLELLKTISSEDKTRFCVSLTKDVAVKFAEWKDRLTPAQKCTVHPPVGSGASTGIYTKTDSDLFDYFITNIYKP